jgi:hypothetical protein
VLLGFSAQLFAALHYHSGHDQHAEEDAGLQQQSQRRDNGKCDLDPTA